MKKTIVALFLITALIAGFSIQTSEQASMTFPDPTASVKL